MTNIEQNVLEMLIKNATNNNNTEQVLYSEQYNIDFQEIKQDLTEIKQLRDDLKKAKKCLSMSQRLAHMGSWVMDVTQKKNYWSEEAYKIFGIARDDFNGTYEGFLKFVHPDDVYKIQNILNNPPSKPIIEMEFRIIRADGNVRDIFEVMEFEYDCNNNLAFISGTIHDITEKKKLQNALDYIATHDELTGLPNSAYFRKQLNIQCREAKESNTRFAIMMLDIDGLKYFNYSLGYDLGYELILEIVKRLRNFLGKNIFISRYSEDHFAILLNNLQSNREYENIAKGIINLFKRPFRIDAYDLDVFVNIGISIYNNNETDMDTLRKQAKITLLRAKKEGKNTYKFYSSDMDVKSYKEFILRNDLHHAIEKEQLKVYYQPIVNLKTNEIIAAETLIRWEHPEWGLVGPEEFIPLAEETGLIIGIGKWVLKEVCSNYKKWSDKKLPYIKVTVNFSGIQFMENDFVKNIKGIIDEFEMDPHFLVIEITESILIKNAEKAASDIQNLHDLGIQVALDDFGTGYSSLTYLNTFRIDIIKIGGSFIKKIPYDAASNAIIKHLINLGDELQIKLVAEGIENWKQLSYLKEFNCFCGQGYIYSKALPFEQFNKILIKRKCRPVIINSELLSEFENRRNFYRINLNQLLEASMTIKEIKGKKINVGYTKVLIKNIGPGGLCFISNIRIPVEKDFILQFITQLLGKDHIIHGCTVWAVETDDCLYEYGAEFILDEKERSDLVKVLNNVHLKMRNNILFSDGSFVPCSPAIYFKTV